MENTGIKGLFVTLYQRVILSYKSTFIGIGLYALSLVLQFTIDSLTKSSNPLVSQLGAALGAIFVLVKDKMKAPVIPPAAVAVLLALFAFGARAQEVPIGGGCLKNQTTCFGPSFGVALASWDLKTGNVDTTFAPGAGYGVTWFVGKWYEAGFAGYVNLRPTDSGQRIVLSGVGTFARYLRLGLAYQTGSKEQQKPYLLLSLGSDFGRAEVK